MCIWLPLLLLLGTALLTWLAAQSHIRSTVESEYDTRLSEADERYSSLSSEYIAYAEKQKQNETNYLAIKNDYDAVATDRGNWKTKYTNLFIESDQQIKSYRQNLQDWEDKFKQIENDYAESIKAKDFEIADWSSKVSNIESQMIMAKSINEPETKVIEIERIVEKIVEVPVEVIKEVEKIIEVEVVREVEVIKEIEVIKEVEKLVEVQVPVDVVREVEVIKEIEVIREVEKIVEVQVPVDVVREVEVIKEIEVIKEVEKLVEIEVIKEVKVPVEIIREIEVIKEVEVIREVPVEIIREVEVVREVDMESLLAMLSQVGTVEVSRTTRDAEPIAVVQEKVIPMAEITPSKRDDLTIIEGIGPKIFELLTNEGIASFKQLAITEISYLKILLERAGSRFQMHKPHTWPEQARLAAEGKWDDLQTLQNDLKAGKAE